jgi:hypothetical protein
LAHPQHLGRHLVPLLCGKERATLVENCVDEASRYTPHPALITTSASNHVRPECVITFHRNAHFGTLVERDWGFSYRVPEKSYLFMTPVNDFIRRSYDHFAIARKVKMIFCNSCFWLGAG